MEVWAYLKLDLQLMMMTNLLAVVIKFTWKKIVLRNQSMG